MPAEENSEVAVRAQGLTKSFGPTRALDNIDFEITRGTVLGLLGPNGAGKTTTVRILSTLLLADRGDAWVAGKSVRHDPQGVRRSIGLSGQYAAVDENLTGFENLYMVGRLYGMRKKAAGKRASDLLSQFSLEDAAGRPSRTYSGGMRRRLDLAGSLIARPPVVILDEPTTGLDPRGRMDTWDFVKELVSAGTTVLLTTQYLEEADQLADRIIVVDRGRMIAQGTANELKAQVGDEWLSLTVANSFDLPATSEVVEQIGNRQPAVNEHTRTVTVSVTTGAKAVLESLTQLEARHIDVIDIGLHRPTLDDVFLSITGHEAGDR